VDRGPFHIPRSGIPYLSKDAYPYHLFHEAHPDLIRVSGPYSVNAAAAEFLGAYLRGAVFARPRKLASMFKSFLSSPEIETAIEGLVEKGTIAMRKRGRETMVLVRRSKA
jgi:hypothetical protein